MFPGFLSTAPAPYPLPGPRQLGDALGDVLGQQPAPWLILKQQTTETWSWWPPSLLPREQGSSPPLLSCTPPFTFTIIFDSSSLKGHRANQPRAGPSIIHSNHSPEAQNHVSPRADPN